MKALANTVISDQAKIGMWLSIFNMKGVYLSSKKNTDFLNLGSSLLSYKSQSRHEMRHMEQEAQDLSCLCQMLGCNLTGGFHHKPELRAPLSDQQCLIFQITCLGIHAGQENEYRTREETGKRVRTIIGELCCMISLCSQTKVIILDVNFPGKAGKFCSSQIQVFDLAEMYFAHKCAGAWEGFFFF